MNYKGATFLTGELVYLKTPDIDQDVINGKWHSWFNDKQVTKYLGQGVFPNTIEKQIKYVESLNDDRSKVLLCIFDKINDSHIGVISLNDIDFLNRKCTISIVMGEKVHTPGAALEAMALMIEYGFDRLNLNKIWAAQVIDLWKWCNQLELIGFRLEGYHIHAYIRDNNFYDAVYIGVTAERFYKLKKDRQGKICTDNIRELMKKRRKDNLAVPFKEFINNLYS